MGVEIYAAAFACMLAVPLLAYAAGAGEKLGNQGGQAVNTLRKPSSTNLRDVRLQQRATDRVVAPMMDALADMIAHNVDAHGVENIPDSGPAMVVCNHPTGIADGIILWSVLRRK